MRLTYPLMVMVPEISARIGRTTGQGIAGNTRQHYRPWVAQSAIALMLIANVINLAADLGAMGDMGNLVIGGPLWPYVVACGLVCIAMQVVLRYARYASVMKWLTLALLAYFGTLMTVRIP